MPGSLNSSQLFPILDSIKTHNLVPFMCKTYNSITLLLLYVNDMIITRDDNTNITDLKNSLS